ncbi:uncharacterized protein EHS24_005538 [Apiotrichum porosum]|uniref:F-box domain-containing protein n=1 Tax=Apiotrichum porosum TaxID=105984 RepID=A0A427XCG6_9TREE|nr:uncharacterized protein EHS24_005538 [Apiotrichum porosum]RSH76549.1 hypothetical protein EHS24_005538 [Apiotrichum porosum]
MRFVTSIVFRLPTSLPLSALHLNVQLVTIPRSRLAPYTSSLDNVNLVNLFTLGLPVMQAPGHHSGRAGDVVTLPPELVRHIVSYLNPKKDQRSLINVLAVSTTWWDAGAQVLYQDMTLDPERLRLLISGGQPAELAERHKLIAPTQRAVTRSLHRRLQPPGGMLSPRTRRALQFVERLTLIASFSEADYVMFCAIAGAVPNTPLFPRVRTLCYRTRSDSLFGDWYRGRIPKAAGPGVVFFDCPDLCLVGAQSVILFCLPARRIQSITCHFLLTDDLLNHRLPRQGESVVVYEDFAGRLASVVEMNSCLLKWERELQKQSDVNVRICIRSSEAGRFDILARLAGSVGWEPQATAKIQLLFYGDNGIGCPPCVVCGKSQWSTSAHVIRTNLARKTLLDRTTAIIQPLTTLRVSVRQVAQPHHHTRPPGDMDSHRGQGTSVLSI